MSELREPQLIVATGRKGVGKTFKTCRVIREYITPRPDEGKIPRRVLIFDVNKEYTQAEMEKNGHGFNIHELALADLPRWVASGRVEVRRILPIDANGRPVGIHKFKQILEFILLHYRSGMFVMEDINRYVESGKDADILGVITTNRHIDLDIYIHLQSLSKVTTGMWQNANHFRMHHQQDPVTRYMNRMNYPDLFRVAQLLINHIHHTREPRICVYCDNNDGRIRGEYKPSELVKAIKTYLLEEKKLIKNRASLYGGKKDENERKALIECSTEFFKNMWGGTLSD